MFGCKGERLSLALFSPPPPRLTIEEFFHHSYAPTHIHTHTHTNILFKTVHNFY